MLSLDVPDELDGADHAALLAAVDEHLRDVYQLRAPLDLAAAAPYVPPTGTTATVMLMPSGAFAGAVLGWSGTALAWQAGGGGSATRGLIVTDADVPTIPAGDTTDNLAAYYNSAAEPITVEGVELAAGSHAVWVWVAGAWSLLSSGTGGVPVAAEPPAWTAGTTATTGTPAEDSVTVTLSSAKPAGLLEMRYGSGDVWRTSGFTLAGNVVTLTGLNASTVYAAPQFRVTNSAGSSAELTAQGFTTAAPAPEWVTVFLDTFTDADGTALSAHTPDIGTWDQARIAMPADFQIKDNAARFVNVGGSSWAQLTAATTAVTNDNPNSRATIEYNGGAASNRWATAVGFYPHHTDYYGVLLSILRDGTITIGAPGVTVTETTGFTTLAPLAGTAVVTVSAADNTAELKIDGTLFRRWTISALNPAVHYARFALSGGDTSVVGQVSDGRTSLVRLEFLQ